jgi:glycosyl transferase family 25
VQIFVINLKARKDRRDNVTAQLSATGLHYEFFPAVEGTGQLHRYFRGENRLQFLLETGHFAAPAEINCYASHLSLWKQCVALNQPIVILEDDLQVTPDFRRMLACAGELIMDHGFIRLEPMGTRWQRIGHFSPRLMRSVDGTDLYMQPMPAVHTTGYAISPACAAAFISVSNTLSAPVDHMIRRCWSHKQHIFALTPPAIVPGALATATSITGREKHPVRHFAGMLRPLYRLLERWKARTFCASFNQDGDLGSFRTTDRARKAGIN